MPKPPARDARIEKTRAEFSKRLTKLLTQLRDHYEGGDPSPERRDRVYRMVGELAGLLEQLDNAIVIEFTVVGIPKKDRPF
jgi:hypothetical protein